MKVTIYIYYLWGYDSYDLQGRAGRLLHYWDHQVSLLPPLLPNVGGWRTSSLHPATRHIFSCE